MASFISRKMTIGALREADADEAAGMLLSLCTASYHDQVFYGVESQNAEIEKPEAARILKQFFRCYRPTGSSY